MCHHHDGHLLLLLLIIRFWTVNLVSIVSKSQMYVLNVGDSIVLECFFKADTYNLFDYPLLWRKIQRDEESQVNIMGNVNQPFLATTRYEVNFAAGPPLHRLNLCITGVIQEDSGNYTCEVRGPHSVILDQVTHFVLVRASIDSVVIVDNLNGTGNTEGVSQQKLHLVENVRTAIRCLVSGGYPPPIINVFLNERNITRDFRFRIWSNSTGGRGLRVLRQHYEGVASAFVVHALEHQASLRCTAYVPGLKRITANTVINVSYGPKISCFSTRASLWEKNVNLRCEIRSNPRFSALYWIIDGNGTTLAEGEVVDGRWILVADRSDGVVETQLFLYRIEPSSFRKYILVAENSVSLATEEAELVRSVLSRAIDSANANHNFNSRGGGGGGGAGGGGGGGKRQEEEEKERREGRLPVSGVSGDNLRADETVRAYVRSASTRSTDATTIAAFVCSAVVVAAVLM